MRLLVFGAAGRVDRSVVEVGLAAGHDVTAFVRTPAKLTIGHERMFIVQGDALDAAAVRASMDTRFDAVIGALGDDPAKPSTIVQDSTRIIVEAMRATGQTRYLGVGALGLLPASGLGRIFVRLIRVTPLRHGLRDHTAALEILRGSDLTWTLAAPPLITDAAPRGNYKVVAEFRGGMSSIAALDLADFLIRELEAQRYPNQPVGVWY